ncbi:hypothetical protein J6590_073606 [Homalodisca vitripennis]|nr:hypothetical protein J6590_073606 [Homalodisca vitripennis]
MALQCAKRRYNTPTNGPTVCRETLQRSYVRRETGRDAVVWHVSELVSAITRGGICELRGNKTHLSCYYSATNGPTVCKETLQHSYVRRETGRDAVVWHVSELVSAITRGGICELRGNKTLLSCYYSATNGPTVCRETLQHSYVRRETGRNAVLWHVSELVEKNRYQKFGDY